MTQDNLIEFKTPESSESFTDALTTLVRQGAQQIVAQAVEAELQAFLSQYQHLQDEQGRKTIVRNGYLPERMIMTEVGEVVVQVPKVRVSNDNEAVGRRQRQGRSDQPRQSDRLCLIGSQRKRH